MLQDQVHLFNSSGVGCLNVGNVFDLWEQYYFLLTSFPCLFISAYLQAAFSGPEHGTQGQQ